MSGGLRGKVIISRESPACAGLKRDIVTNVTVTSRGSPRFGSIIVLVTK